MTVDEATDVLKALADPTRLRLMVLLHEHGTLCVCELEAVLELPQYTVSRHLGILRRVGLVDNSRDGARVDYALRADLDATVRRLIAAAAGVVEADEVVQQDGAAARSVRPKSCAV